MEKIEFQVGQVIRMKKQHPCGADCWEIQRVGMDFRIRCQGCGRSVMLPRKTVEQKMKELVSQ